jgi:hypothetical protein
MSVAVEHRFADVNGVRLHYAISGSGPLMLCVHGFPQCLYTFRHQLAEFARDHTVVAMDLRGYNLSSKPANLWEYGTWQSAEDCRALVEHLGFSDSSERTFWQRLLPAAVGAQGKGQMTGARELGSSVNWGTSELRGADQAARTVRGSDLRWDRGGGSWRSVACTVGSTRSRAWSDRLPGEAGGLDLGAGAACRRSECLAGVGIQAT